MEIEVALCQLQSVPTDVRANAETVIRTMESCDADLFLFPELFLTGYVGDGCGGLESEVAEGLDRIRGCTGRDRAAVVGAPRYTASGIRNSAYFESDSSLCYDKLNLPSFGVFSEKDTFVPGKSPVMVPFGGARIGLTICYDLFFPELYRFYAMNGADAFVCISASPVSSRPYFEKVLPARSVENTSYTLFVNNMGIAQGLKMAGCSRAVSPLGEDMTVADERERILTVTVDTESAAAARELRTTVSDVRNDIEWL